MNWLRRITGLTSLLLLCVPAISHASSPEICAPTMHIDKYRFLRQLSLDLWGRIPTISEYRALDELTEVPEQLIDEMMESEEFYATVREYHRNLLWPTLDPYQGLVIGFWILQPNLANNIWYSYERSSYLRGAVIPCLDQPQTQFDAEGHPIPIMQALPGCPAGGCKMDGYVMVTPYWAPDTQIKVCAYEAQAQATGTYGSCESDATRNEDLRCGCGPNLKWCIGGYDKSTYGSDHLMRASLLAEPLLIFEAMVRENRPYFDALSTTETYVNGPLAHYYKNVAGRWYVHQSRMNPMPDIQFTNMTYVRHEREALHSGILTTFAYLQRFTSNRARADRFYSSFLCKPFMTPVGGLPPATDPCSSEPNLSERCGCANCHATLEPAASHWGRWEHSEFYGYLHPTQYPVTRQDCATCAPGTCPADCAKYYVTQDTVTTDKERPYLGILRAFEWRTPEEQAAVDIGPSALVARGLESGDLARCSARNLSERMLHRGPTDDESLEGIPQLASDFAASGYNFKALIREIAMSDTYRAIY